IGDGADHHVWKGVRRLRRAWCFGVSRRRYEQVRFVPDESVLAVDSELVVFAHEDRRNGTGFLTVAAEDTARLVNLIDLGGAGGGEHRNVVLLRLQVDGIGWTGHGTESAGNAFLQTVFVAHQHLFPAIFR